MIQTILLTIAAVIIIIHLISAFSVDRRLEYKEISFRSPKIPPSLSGYTIAFLTDIHGSKPNKLMEMVSKINEHGTDLVLLGGDFSEKEHRAERCIEILAQIESGGIYGVAGNHDDATFLKSVMASNNMILLEDEGLRIKDRLYVAGLKDIRENTPDVKKALRGAEIGDFVLLLCHNPDTSMKYDFSAADLALCGHCHGGEITFFGMWAPTLYKLSKYGQRFRTGWCKSNVGDCIYVSNGIGKHLPVRSFARPQVIYLTLKSGVCKGVSTDKIVR